MSSLMDKLRKNSTISSANPVSESIYFEDKDLISTSIPAMNVILSGSFTGGFAPGHTMWAGPSKHFKTLFSLIMAEAYMRQYPDSVLAYFDNEFGTPGAYFRSLNIPTERVLHVPIRNIEEMKHEVITQLEGINRGDKVMMIIDSIGNVASAKELADALKGDSPADMTRAKALKSFFRMVTPYLSMNDIPLVTVNHTYQTLEMFSRTIVSGGTGSYYSADNIYVVGREQDKDGEDLVGYDFKIRVEKSRFVREKSVIPITVNFDSGISRWSGLFDMATEAGVIVAPPKKVLTVEEKLAARKMSKEEKAAAKKAASEEQKAGWYKLASNPDKQFRRKDTECAEFWNPIINDPNSDFSKWVESNYRLGASKLIQGDEAEVA